MNEWSKVDEVIMAEVVLRRMRQGYDGKIAFLEAANRVKKAPEECQKYWEESLSHNYEQAIEIAKNYAENLHFTTSQGNVEMDDNINEETIKGNTITSKEENFEPVDKEHVSDVISSDKKGLGDEIVQTTINLDDVIEFFTNLKKQQTQDKTNNEHERLLKEKEQLLSEIQTLKRKIKKVEDDMEQHKEDYDEIAKIIFHAKNLAEEKNVKKSS